jgi:hypothetical protein
MKIWQKDKSSLAEVEKFTVGNDRELDIHLAPFDVFGSLAHIRMLESVACSTRTTGSSWRRVEKFTSRYSKVNLSWKKAWKMYTRR